MLGSFVVANTNVTAPPLVPELRLHLAEEPCALWERTEEELGGQRVEPPFWAFAWAGGQALARYVLDHPEVVRGRSVLDVASGSGLVALAAIRAGAGEVTASDVDRHAAAAILANAALNGLLPPALAGDVLDAAVDADVVLVGDAFYERKLADRVLPFLRRAVAAGARVLIGDPGRAYLPTGLSQLATYDVPVSLELESTTSRTTRVLTF